MSRVTTLTHWPRRSPGSTPERSIRVGAPATFTRPVILDYRNSAWKLQPTTQLTAGKYGYYDPRRLHRLVAELSRERGEDIDLACFLNDARSPNRDEEPVPDPVANKPSDGVN